MQIISKEEAKERKLNRYYTGKPCKNGHTSERYVNGGGCCQCAKEKRDRYHRENREEIIERKRQWRKDNPEKVREYREKTKEYRNERDKKYRKERYSKCPEFRAAEKCRSLLYRTLKATSKDKNGTTYCALGYSGAELMYHLEGRFLDGMSWGNADEWHIDHIYPVSRYVADGIEDPAIINALDNLAPMWAEHNLEKGDLTLEEWFEVKPERENVYGHLLKDEV